MQYKNNNITCIIPNTVNNIGAYPTEMLLIDKEDNIYTFETSSILGVEILQIFLDGLIKERGE